MGTPEILRLEVPDVDHWLLELRSCPHFTPFFKWHHCLDSIDSGMIVVPLDEAMFKASSLTMFVTLMKSLPISDYSS